MTREQSQLQKQYLKVLEENNLLKYVCNARLCRCNNGTALNGGVCRYKVELLLDMLAASNADCIVLQRELNTLKKPPPRSPQKK